MIYQMDELYKCDGKLSCLVLWDRFAKTGLVKALKCAALARVGYGKWHIITINNRLVTCTHRCITA